MVSSTPQKHRHRGILNEREARSMNRKSLVDATPGTDDLPDLFDNTQAMVFEIDAALRQARGAVSDLAWARVARSLE